MAFWNDIPGMQNYPGYGTASTATTENAPGTLPGAAARGYTPASGGVPAMPSPQASQAAAIGGNVANLPALTGQAGTINQFNLGEVLKQYQAGVPGWDTLSGQSSVNIGASLRGELPADVLTQMQQAAAERGIATGSPGSPNANAAYLRALGLTSLGQQRYGEQALTGAVARMPRTALYNLTSDLVTPQQQQEAAYMANVLQAAPIPQDAYNQALAAGQAGQMRGYGAARNYGSSGNWLTDLVNKYSPGGGMQTVPGTTSSTGSGVMPVPGTMNPSMATQAEMDELDWMYGEGGLGLPAYGTTGDTGDWQDWWDY